MPPTVDDISRRVATATITDLEELAVGSGTCWAVVAALVVVGELLYTAAVGGGLGGSTFGVLVGAPVVLAVVSFGLASAAEVYEVSTGRTTASQDLLIDDCLDSEERRE